MNYITVIQPFINKLLVLQNEQLHEDLMTQATAVAIIKTYHYTMV